MPRRITGKENIRNIQKTRSSYYLTLPMRFMRNLGWRERQKVVVRLFGKGLRIKDWPEKKK